MYIMFIDESGDHGLSNIDINFPVFALCGVITHIDDYYKLKADIISLKAKFWGDKKVILHSRDIRKCDKEFQVLLNTNIKATFYNELNTIIESANYTIVSSVVHKEKYIEKYGKLGDDIYSISLSFILERAVFYLDANADKTSEFYIVIEKRGNKEDKNLASHCQKILSRGTSFVTSSRFIKHGLKFTFRDKKEDVTGLQLADLIAYPIATHCIDKERANPAFELLKNKFYMKGNRNFGLKEYP